MTTSQITSAVGAEILRRFGHSLRSPLNEIAGTARLMLAESVESEERRNLTRIEDAADQILDVLNDLLDVAELESGELAVQEVPFRLPDVIREAVRSKRALAEERRIDMSVHGLAALPTELIGDPGRIRQVIGHLIADAIRTSSAGRVQVAAQLVDHNPSSAVVRFGVRRPSPLTDRQRRDLEEPFSASPGDEQRTDGMGLAIAAKVVDVLGGHIRVGTTGSDTLLDFTLTFKRASGNDTGHEAEVPSNTWVAVIADNAVLGESLIEGLRVGGFEPTLYESIALATTAIAMSDDDSVSPAAVVIAPSAEPFDVAARAVASPVLSRSRMMLVVPHGLRGDADECIRLGVEGYFPQPIGSVDLIEGVRVLASRKTDGPLVTRHSLRERRTSRHILVVDDSPTGRAVVMRSLEQLGHTTAAAANGRTAVEMVATEPFDAVLMDMEMPEMDGVAATRVIRSGGGSTANTPIIGLSAHAFSADRKACLEAGMNEHFTKPFRIEQLQVALERILGS